MEYQSILAELQRQQEVCLQKLRLPNIQLPNYPSPISLKTPPSIELEGEEVEYYLDKFEKIEKERSTGCNYTSAKNARNRGIRTTTALSYPNGGI